MERLGSVLIVAIVSLHILKVLSAPQDYNECKVFSEKGLTGCCKRPEGLKDSAETIAIKKNCDHAVMGDKHMPGKAEDRLSVYECMDECFFNTTKQFTEELKPNEEAIIAILQEEFESYPQWKESVVKAVKACINTDYVSRLREGAKCKSGVIQLEECLGKHMFLNCPADAWQSNRLECNNAKETYTKCTPTI